MIANETTLHKRQNDIETNIDHCSAFNNKLTNFPYLVTYRTSTRANTVIIGAETKNILHIGILNKYCYICN